MLGVICRVVVVSFFRSSSFRRLNARVFFKKKRKEGVVWHETPAFWENLGFLDLRSLSFRDCFGHVPSGS